MFSEGWRPWTQCRVARTFGAEAVVEYMDPVRKTTVASRVSVASLSPFK